MSYPKILIVGRIFDLRTGGGITLIQLFKGWDKVKIAVAAERIEDPDFSVCETYYQLGSLESKRRFPFNLNHWGDDIHSGIIGKNDTRMPPLRNWHKKKSLSERLYHDFLRLTGLTHYKRKLIISDKFLNWIKEYSPDYIYTQLEDLRLIRLVDSLNNTLKIPIAIHFMDDWPATISLGCLFKAYWDSKIDKELRALLAKAEILMSISDTMSEAYYNRYGLQFKSFHNPIEIENWLPYSKISWSTEGPFKILYTGRIGTANNKSMIFFAKLVDRLNQTGDKIKLDIHTTDKQSAYAQKMKTYQGIEVKGLIPHKSMACLLAQYDLLLLPLDFDDESINFARYSMPTKTSEYMISGTPILIFASLQTAVAKYASRDGWAYVVSENNSDILHDALNQLIKNEPLRRSIGEKAKKTAIQKENASVVRELFRRSFIED